MMILSGYTYLSGQDLRGLDPDSLFMRFINSRQMENGNIHPISLEDSIAEDIKCGFGLAARIKLNFNRFNARQQEEILKALQRPASDTSILSPSGLFRIHYDRSGINAPAYNTNLTADENAFQVGIAADSAYNFEVNFLGYPPPPNDNGEGGDNHYDIYITSIRNYGSTEIETPLGNQRYTSYIKIHPDYINFFSQGLNGMLVTIAHEMHHAIQIGNYTFDKYDQDAFFYEMTSTSMEEFVYDSINDYYDYLPGYFYNTDRSFTSNSGYSLAIWSLYLKEIFGFGIIKKQWELLPEMRAMDAINAAIFDAGSSFREELNTFGIWTYFTGDRFSKGLGQGFAFEEGNLYPEIITLVNRSFSPPEDIFELSLHPATNNLLRILIGEDTLAVLITNSDIIQANSNPDIRTNFSYGLYDHFIDGSDIITNLYYKNTQSSNPVNWKTTEILNDSVIIHPVLVEEKIPSVFPLPFIYGKNGDYIRFPVSSPKNLNVDFNVYTIGMELVYSGSMTLLPFNEIGGYVVSWTPLDSGNRRLSSGVYLYMIKSGDDIQKGKFVVFNE